MKKAIRTNGRVAARTTEGKGYLDITIWKFHLTIWRED